MTYCPYTDKDLNNDQMSPEHIIPLSLGGIDGFEIPVCKEFNKQIGSEVDAKIGAELIIQSKRTKLKVKGHSGKIPSMYYKKALDVKTGLPLQLKITKDEGVRLNAPYVPKSSPRPEGLQIEFNSVSDPEIWLKYVAKVSLSAGYFSYGDLFRHKVNTYDLRCIMTMSHDELMELKPEIKADAHYIYMEDTKEIEMYKKVCKVVGELSCVGMVPGDNSLTFFCSILGQYVGMIRVEADTTDFPNQGRFSWGHFICIGHGKIGRMSYYELMKLFERYKN